jgi:hypothetical protein
MSVESYKYCQLSTFNSQLSTNCAAVYFESPDIKQIAALKFPWSGAKTSIEIQRNLCPRCLGVQFVCDDLHGEHETYRATEDACIQNNKLFHDVVLLYLVLALGRVARSLWRAKR